MLGQTFLYLLDYVTRRSEKLDFVKRKRMVWRHIGEKCLHDLSKYNYKLEFEYKQ